MKHCRNSLRNYLKTQNEALIDLLLGILIIGAVVILAGLLLFPGRWQFVLGALLGTASSVGRAIHMSVTLERQMDMGGKAAGYAARNYAIRYFSVIVVLLLSVKLGHWGIAGAFIGLLLMKPAALLAPKVHKYIYTRLCDRGKPDGGDQ